MRDVDAIFLLNPIKMPYNRPLPALIYAIFCQVKLTEFQKGSLVAVIATTVSCALGALGRLK